MAPQLDPHAQVVLDAVAASGEPHLSTLSVEEARERVRAALVTKGAPLSLQSVEDVSLPTPHGPLGLRLYRAAGGPLPVALFVHGGGWTVNDVDTHDDLCRRIAKRSGWMLASVDHRHAPEHRHPAQVEDAHLAYRWLLDNAESIGADPRRCAVIGESSGGTVVANLTLLLRDLGAPLPAYQVLAYPATDEPGRARSYTERAEGYILDRVLMDWYYSHYLPPDWSREDPYLFPLATEDLSGLPPALVLTAEFDPVRDEGRAYARRLSEAGVDVEHIHADDQMHGFLLLARVVPTAEGLIERVADALERVGRGG